MDEETRTGDAAWALARSARASSRSSIRPRCLAGTGGRWAR